MGQFQVGLIDQRRRLECIVLLVLAPDAARDAMQFGVDQRYELIKRARITLAPCGKQRSDVTLRVHPRIFRDKYIDRLFRTGYETTAEDGASPKDREEFAQATGGRPAFPWVRYSFPGIATP